MPTRALFERRMIGRCGPLMAEVGMDAETEDGTNADLEDALSWSFGEASDNPAAGDLPTDEEIAAIPMRTFDNRMLLLGEYRVLVTCRNRWTSTRIKVGQNEWFESDLRDSLDKRLAQLERLPVIKEAIGGVATLTGGGITLGGMYEAEEDSE